MRIGSSASRLVSARSSGALALILAWGLPLLGCGTAVIGDGREDGGDPIGAEDGGGDPLADGGDEDAGAGAEDAGQPGADAGEPGTDEDAGEPSTDEDAGEPSTDEDAGEPGTDEDAGEPGADEDAGEPGADEDAGEPGVDAGEPGADAGEPGADAGEPGTDAGEPGADAGEPGADAGTDPLDAGEPGTDEDAGQPDAGEDDAGDADGGAPDDGGTLSIMERCFPEIFDPAFPGPDYDQFAPVIGSHCRGTDHQDITGVERVVFLGDSITVGSPPTLSGNFYRSRLASELADYFDLDTPDALWRSANLFTGTSSKKESGDFASCAKWGARTVDLAGQLDDCLPTSKRDKTTLVIITIGGNDLAKVAKDGRTASWEHNVATVQAYVDLLRLTVEWLMEPGRFPNGVYVVFANVYEFTDGTADLESCPATSLGDWLSFANFENWADPDPLRDLMVWANEEYMRIAVENGADMMFLFESFCGHGFHSNDPTSPCYRGPNTARWFDSTCIHPNPTGHARIADYFLDVITE